tara:strand:+ start:326 stop:574 length:249 start_codon:yes stop_codon:yes gene_type:complete
MKITDIISEAVYLIKRVESGRIIVTNPQDPTGPEIAVELDDKVLDTNGPMVIVRGQMMPSERAQIARRILKPGMPVDLQDLK